jgi:hypothetical protein
VSSHRTTLSPVDQLALFAAERDALPRFRARAATGRDLRDTFNGRLLKGVTLVGPYDIPRIEGSQFVPGSLMAFSEAMAMSRPDARAWVHFYEDDYRFRRLWTAPERYLNRLRQFAGVISPDFSVYRNMPVALKIEHTYRNQLLGAWLQARGLNVIPNVRLSGHASVPYALAGVPRQSSIAIGLHGCTRNKANRIHVLEEIRLICDLQEPTSLIVYGSDAFRVLDHAREVGIPVHLYRPDSYRRGSSRKGAA